MSGISIGGDMHGDVVQGNQHKGDVVHGDKSQGQTNIAGDMSGNITQTFTAADLQEADAVIAAVCAKVLEVLDTELPEAKPSFEAVAEELQTKAANPASAAAPYAWFADVSTFFQSIPKVAAKAALAGGLAVLDAAVSKNPVLAGLKAVFTELYNGTRSDT